MRHGKAVLAMAMAGGLAVAGCGFKINPKEPEYMPKIGGNTFDLHNDLAVTLPVAERINISYEYVEAWEKGFETEAPGIYDGTLWWYEERTAADPEQFVGIHLLTRDEEYKEATGQLVKLSRTNYTAQTYCLDLTKGEIPPELLPIVRSLFALGHELSTDLYIRRYVLRDEREDRGRTDVIYARDVVRLGYTCEGIGDLASPSPGSEEIVNKLQSDAQASFEVMT
ncbi:MAG: hypothetical protein RLW87_12370 [Alphaproteobacteria bacterium]